MIQRVIISDAEEEDDVLGKLEDLLDDLPYDNPSPQQIYSLYGIFLRDIVKNPILIKGVPLTYNRNTSKHPLCKGKVQGFEHIITREDKIAKRRYFDRERANKIHWIRPIIEHVDDPRIKYFERVNDEGLNQQFYWYSSKSFVVILRELNPDLILITSFSVDKSKKNELKSWYDLYK